MIKKILHFLARLLLLLLLTALVLGGILLYNLQMNKSFITTFYTVTVDKPVEDLRIVLLSDLHLSEYGTDNADLVRKVRSLAPDLVAVAGDMDIDTDPDYSLVLSLMRQLVDIAPVYYAPGNHEWAARYANGCDTIFDDIEATGVHWMNGTYEDAVINGKKLRIGGQGLWSTSQGFLPKYTSGVNQMGESQVVISRGLGDSEPYPRIFNQPELVVVDVN